MERNRLTQSIASRPLPLGRTMNRSFSGLGGSAGPSGTAVAAPGVTDQAVDPAWARLSRALVRENPDFRTANPMRPSVSPLADLPLVGTAVGRKWEVRYLRPRFLATHRVVGLTTGIRWSDPPKMRNEPIPWLYVGPRPGLLARSSAELDRVMQWSRQSEGHIRGISTGDREFDRHWLVYASRPEVAFVLGNPVHRRALTGLAELRSGRSGDIPTITSIGTTAVLSLIVSDSDATAQGAARLPRMFGSLLDQFEAAAGRVPASSVPLAMDFVPDETGYPEPALRLRCTYCGQDAHPRHRLDLETDLCDQCGKSFYQFL